MNKPPANDVFSTEPLPLDWIIEALPPELGDVRQVETVKLRPWSQVYRIVADQGISYFKICGPDAQYEVSLLEVLSPEYSAILPEIIALSSEQGWILMADAGISFRDLPQADPYHQNLPSLLSSYAKLQQHSLKHTNDLLKMSLPDRRLEQLPRLVQELITTGKHNGWFEVELPNQMLSTLPTLEWLCQYLAIAPYAAALDHGDLHTGNVLFKNEKFSICDWGDACITHPFCSLLPWVAASVGEHFASMVEVVEITFVSDYLQNWRSFASLDTLKEEMPLALCLGLVLRALDIAYMLQRADAESVNRWSPYVSKYLAQWVQIEATIPRTNLNPDYR